MTEHDRHLDRRTVIYVPPINGSDTRVWNAEMPTNCTVLQLSSIPLSSLSQNATHDANDPATVEKIKNAKNAPLIGGSGNQYTVSVATKQNNNLGQ